MIRSQLNTAKLQVLARWRPGHGVDTRPSATLPFRRSCSKTTQTLEPKSKVLYFPSNLRAEHTNTPPLQQITPSLSSTSSRPPPPPPGPSHTGTGTGTGTGARWADTRWKPIKDMWRTGTGHLGDPSGLFQVCFLISAHADTPRTPTFMGLRQLQRGSYPAENGRKTLLQQRGQRDGRQQQQPMARRMFKRGRGQQVSGKAGVRSGGGVRRFSVTLELGVRVRSVTFAC